MFGKKISYGLIGLTAIAMFFTACDPEPEQDLTMYDEVRGFTIDASGAKILATDAGLISFKDGNWNPVTIADGNATILNDLTTSGQNIWLATNAGIINQTSGSSVTSSNSCLSGDFVSRVFVDDQARIYASTTIGVSVIDNMQCFETLGTFDGIDLYAEYDVTDIGTASNGYTYVTTYGGGVGRFAYDIDGISGATIMDENWSEIKTNYVYTVFIEDTIQWYGSENGVAKHYSHRTKWDWDTWHTSDGLISDTVISIARDTNDNIWFGTNKGISRFNEETEIWTNYDVNSHNIINDTVSYIAAGSDGSVWIATNTGLSAFDGAAWTNYSNIIVVEE